MSVHPAGTRRRSATTAPSGIERVAFGSVQRGRRRNTERTVRCAGTATRRRNDETTGAFKRLFTHALITAALLLKHIAINISCVVC